MGRESTSYFLPIPPESADGVVPALREGGAQLVGSGHSWIDLRVCDPDRYWIDLRLHRGPTLLLEVRIALTNDEWSIRGPLEAAFTTLPPAAAHEQLRDEDGHEIGMPGEAGWSLRLEEDYGRRRAEFVKTIGDYTAPISADHVYMWIHQTRTRRFDERDLEWRREAEISRMEQMMEGEPQLPDDHPDNMPGDE